MSKYLRYLKKSLNNFKSNLIIFESVSYKDEITLDLKEYSDYTFFPYSIFMALVYFAGFKYWGKQEKVAWSIPFTYKNKPYLISHEKFGVKLRTFKTSILSKELTKEMLYMLRKALSVTDKLMQPFARKQLRKGSVTIINKYFTLDSMYIYFRNRAKALYKRKKPKKKIISIDSDGNPTGWSCDPLKYDREGFFNTIAMIDAYFSRLEHVLILLLPFVGFNPKKESLTAVISGYWTDKYRRIFKISSDKKAKINYDNLIVIKEKYRNSIMHGFFERNKGSMLFHAPGIGAVPFYLSNFSKSIHYSVYPIQYESFDKICAIFDEFDKFMTKSQTKYGIKYIKSGLDVACDTHSLKKYGKAMLSNKEFNKFIEYMGYLSDRVANMDW